MSNDIGRVQCLLDDCYREYVVLTDLERYYPEHRRASVTRRIEFLERKIRALERNIVRFERAPVVRRIAMNRLRAQALRALHDRLPADVVRYNIFPLLR